MIPNIFISSTIQDLHHLRDSIRDLIFELGFNPVMSEYGDIGYLPTTSAEESCYLALKDCQLAIIIVGKRYGSLSDNSLSVTHNEFKTARKKKVPVIFLVNEEVLSFKKIYDVNKTDEKVNYPGMDHASKMFSFIQEFADSETNNGLVKYTNVQSAKHNLKKQLAHLIGDLLANRFDPVKGEIKDILSEITTLRHMLLKNEQEVAKKFSSTFRFLLNEENKYLKEIAERISGSLEEGVPELLNHSSLRTYLESKNIKIELLESKELNEKMKLDVVSGLLNKEGINKICYARLPYSTNKSKVNEHIDYDVMPESKDDVNAMFAYGKKRFLMNKNAENLLEFIYRELLRVANSSTIANTV